MPPFTCVFRWTQASIVVNSIHTGRIIFTIIIFTIINIHFTIFSFKSICTGTPRNKKNTVTCQTKSQNLVFLFLFCLKQTFSLPSQQEDNMSGLCEAVMFQHISIKILQLATLHNFSCFSTDLYRWIHAPSLYFGPIFSQEREQLCLGKSLAMHPESCRSKTNGLI